MRVGRTLALGLLVCALGARAQTQTLTPTLTPTQTPTPTPTPTLTPTPAQTLSPLRLARLHWLESRLDEGRESATHWWTAWTFAFGVALAGQAVGSATIHDAAFESSLRVGALKTALGFISMVVQPLPLNFGSKSRRARPPQTEAELEARMLDAEARMHRAARSERRGRQWWVHAAGLAVNLGGTAWLWFHDHQPQLALTGFVTGGLVGEARIFTQPTDAIEWEEQLDAAGPDGIPVEPTVRFELRPIPNGGALALRF